MLDTLITSKTRIKLLTKFFLNPQIKAYLRGLEVTFGESSNGIRKELNRFEKDGLLTSTIEGRRKIFKANTTHALYPAVHNIILQHFGINHVIEELTKSQKQIEQIWLSGEYAKGNTNSTIDFLVVGTNIEKKYVEEIKFNDISLLNKKVLFSIFDSTSFTSMKNALNLTEIYLLYQNS